MGVYMLDEVIYKSLETKCKIINDYSIALRNINIPDIEKCHIILECLENFLNISPLVDKNIANEIKQLIYLCSRKMPKRKYSDEEKRLIIDIQLLILVTLNVSGKLNFKFPIKIERGETIEKLDTCPINFYVENACKLFLLKEEWKQKRSHPKN